MWILWGNISYFSVASSALSPAERRTGVEWVWNPVMVLGRPAWPTTSTAWPTRTGTERGLRFSSTVNNILGCRITKHKDSQVISAWLERSNTSWNIKDMKRNNTRQKKVQPALQGQESRAYNDTSPKWWLSYQDMHEALLQDQHAHSYKNKSAITSSQSAIRMQARACKFWNAKVCVARPNFQNTDTYGDNKKRSEW